MLSIIYETEIEEVSPSRATFRSGRADRDTWDVVRSYWAPEGGGYVQARQGGETAQPADPGGDGNARWLWSPGDGSLAEILYRHETEQADPDHEVRLVR